LKIHLTIFEYNVSAFLKSCYRLNIIPVIGTTFYDDRKNKDDQPEG
jgi:hypothetical protein